MYCSQWITNLAESKVQFGVKSGASKNKVTAGVMHSKVADEDATFIEILRAVHAVQREGEREEKRTRERGRERGKEKGRRRERGREGGEENEGETVRRHT